jgi:eukaryotic-like serine/threonine-protein kinase
MSAWAPSAGELVADRFLLVDELARGGMGAVWRAKHTGLDIECAVKFIAMETVTDEMRMRFRREARAAAKLKSRFVVNMLDYGVWQEQPYFAMELLDGESLAGRLERCGRIGVDETLDIVSCVARALAAAWSLGIVHRDLKPANIFLVEEDGEIYAKVLDFGVAKVKEPHLDRNLNTDTGALLGTPWYMSPEQLDGTRGLDVRSDLFALAVITFECLTGELPFDGEALGNLMSKIMHGDRPQPSAILSSLPPALDAWWLRASDIDSQERFATPRDFVESLQNAFDRAPQSTGLWDIPAPQPSLPEREPATHEVVGVVEAEAATQLGGPETFGGQSRASGKRTRNTGRATWAALLAAAILGGAGLWWMNRTPAPEPSPATQPAPETSSEETPTTTAAAPVTAASESTLPTAPTASTAPSASAAAPPSIVVPKTVAAPPIAPRTEPVPVTQPKAVPGGALAPDDPGF